MTAKNCGHLHRPHNISRNFCFVLGTYLLRSKRCMCTSFSSIEEKLELLTWKVLVVKGVLRRFAEEA
jgi:hypothetical protein